MWRPQNKSWHKNKSLTKKILFSEIAVFSWDIFNKNNKLKLVPFNDLCEEITATCSQLLFLWIQINMIFSFILLFFATQCTNKNQGFFCFFWACFIKCFERDEYHELAIFLWWATSSKCRQSVKHAYFCNLFNISKPKNSMVDLQSKFMQG